MTAATPSSDGAARRLPYQRRKTALVLCEDISRRLAVRRSLEAQGFLVASRRGARDLATCRRVYMPELVVVDGAWLQRRPAIYSVLERLARQVRVEVVDPGAVRVPRHAHAVPGARDG